MASPPRLALAATLALVACGREERRELERTLASVERLRDADGPARPAALEALDALTTSLPEAARARTACLDAYRALDATNRLVADAKGPPIDRGKLDAAERSLREARTGLESCQAATTALRRRFER
ncbi:MAG: hypothetical protein FJ095_07290 [Deltaproteobacteria bacterium]|nr:hypothetical protein [Deltaproteobacteria bacterium]